MDRSDPASSLVLAKGDVVKIHLGAHIDGYAATSAETVRTYPQFNLSHTDVQCSSLLVRLSKSLPRDEPRMQVRSTHSLLSQGKLNQ